MRRFSRFLIRGAVAGPPVLAILLSLLPADQLMLWLYGAALALCSLTLLLFVMVQAYRSPYGAYWRRLGQQTVLSFCLVVSVVALNWPMRTAFILSRPALNQAAQQLLAGESMLTPQRMGVFRIVAAELMPQPDGSTQVPSLWTDIGSGGDHMGVVQSGADRPPFIMWSAMRLDRDWQFIYRAE